MTTSVKSIRAGAQSLADQASSVGESALDSTRQFASQALEKAGDKARDLSSTAKDLANRGIEGMADSANTAQKHLVRYADATGRYVSEKPVKAALIAAAVGAVIAGVLIAARRRSNRYY